MFSHESSRKQWRPENQQGQSQKYLRTAAVLAESIERLTAEREVVGLIPVAGQNNTQRLEITETLGTCFPLQMARPSRGSDDDVMAACPISSERRKIVSSIGTFVLNTWTLKSISFQHLPTQNKSRTSVKHLLLKAFGKARHRRKKTGIINLFPVYLKI